MTSSLTKNFIINPVKDIIFFPVWWYSFGLKKTTSWCWQKIKNGEKYFALKILLLNLFKPMYQEYSISGRLISFFARLFLLFFRSIGMLILAVIILFIFFIYLGLPIVTVYNILLQL